MKALVETAMQLGDIVLCTTPDIVSKGIRKVTGSDISHAMVYVHSHSVIDATPDGVHARNTQRLFFDDSHPVYVLRLIERVSETQTNAIIVYLRNRIGTQYSKKEALRTATGGSAQWTRKQFCSRLVAQAYAHSGIRLVDNENYCSPQEIKDSHRLRIVEGAVRNISREEVAAIQASRSTVSLMIDSTNIVLEGARKLNGSIEDLNDIDYHLLQHPEHDAPIAELYEQSGYLSLWQLELRQNAWQYSFEGMQAAPISEDTKSEYCSSVIKEGTETIRRHEVNAVGYANFETRYPLRTFQILKELHSKLVTLHKLRLKAAQDWLNNS
jgi:hypothetical protein